MVPADQKRTFSAASTHDFVKLYKGSLVPLYGCLPGLTWILHDYFITLEDEVRYIWSQKPSLGKFMFLWIRYYSIALLVFDVTQIHLFTRPGITSETVCVAMDSIIRILGAISLWSVEIIMQLRIYALFKSSKKVALINFVLFLGSIAGFLWVLIYNALRRKEIIKDAVRLPLPGCPSIHVGIEWIQWIPATVFEAVLFFWALYKTAETAAVRARVGDRVSLYSLLLRDNIFYFFAVTCLLIFNNLMVVGSTKIPWFSYSPFHAAIGILTTRMLLNLSKAIMSDKNRYIQSSPLESLAFHGTGPLQSGYSTHYTASSRFDDTSALRAIDLYTYMGISIMVLIYAMKSTL